MIPSQQKNPQRSVLVELAFSLDSNWAMLAALATTPLEV
jgi:hypothetical protein